MKKIELIKIKTRIMEFITIILTIAITILGIKYAYLERGYLAQGGEYLIPIFGLLVLILLEDIKELKIEEIKNKIKKGKNKNATTKRRKCA